MKKLLLIVLCLAAFGLMAADKPTGKYMLVYTAYHGGGFGIDPCMSMGSCWTETKVEWFDTFETLQKRMNIRTYSASWSGGFYSENSTTDIRPDNLIGVYEVKSIQTFQYKVGVEEKDVTETVRKQVDKLEWRVKQ
jgi:hypothetical protein